MINWVHQVCKDWGRAQYWLLFGKAGFPTRTMLGKLIEEGVVGAACNQFTMTYPEVLVGDNLIVANAVKRLAEEPRIIVHAHYVVRMPVAKKIKVLGVAPRDYYRSLDDAQCRLATIIEGSAPHAVP